MKNLTEGKIASCDSLKDYSLNALQAAERLPANWALPVDSIGGRVQTPGQIAEQLGRDEAQTASERIHEMAETQLGTRQ